MSFTVSFLIASFERIINQSFRREDPSYLTNEFCMVIFNKKIPNFLVKISKKKPMSNVLHFQDEIYPK